jgi:hypothetical protein
MSKGTRAMWLVLLVVLMAAVLAYLLSDGSIFTSTSITSLLGKFGYDGARDVSETRAVSAAGVIEPIEERGD